MQTLCFLRTSLRLHLHVQSGNLCVRGLSDSHLHMASALRAQTGRAFCLIFWPGTCPKSFESLWNFFETDRLPWVFCGFALSLSSWCPFEALPASTAFPRRTKGETKSDSTSGLAFQLKVPRTAPSLKSPITQNQKPTARRTPSLP